MSQSASSDDLSCKLIGFFVLHDGRYLALDGHIIYRTEITAISGPNRNTSIFIVGRDMFPDGSVICAETEGGPVRLRQGHEEFKFMLHVTRLFYLALDTALFEDIETRYNHIHATGRIVSHTRKMLDGDVVVDIETTAEFKEMSGKWIIVCILSPTPLQVTFTPTKNSLVEVTGLIQHISEYDCRRFDVKVSDMRLMALAIED